MLGFSPISCIPLASSGVVSQQRTVSISSNTGNRVIIKYPSNKCI